MARPLSFRWPDEFVAAIDAARGDVSRSLWVRRAVEQVLGGLVSAAPAERVQDPPAPAEQPVASEQALGSSGRAGVRGRVPALPPAEQPPASEVEMAAFRKITESPPTHVPRVRSSSVARPFRPVPKKGEK